MNMHKNARLTPIGRERMIGDMLRGTRNPSIEVVERIAKALGVSMGNLLDGKIFE